MEINLQTATDEEVEALLLLWSAWKVSEGRDGSELPFPMILESYPRAEELDVESAARWLGRHGLIETEDEALGGPTGICVSATGAQTARQIDEFRGSGRRRRQHLEGRLLTYLLDQEEEHGAHYPSPFKFLDAGEDYLGVPYTQDDVMRAADRLQDLGCIKGVKVNSGRSLLRVTVTALGRRYVERGLQPGDDETPKASGVIINNFAAANNAVNSAHFSQYAAAAEGAWVQPMDQAITLLATMNQAGQFDRPESKAEAEALLHEADSGRARLTKDPEQAKTFLERLKLVAAKGANTAMTAIITASATEAIGLIA